MTTPPVGNLRLLDHPRRILILGTDQSWGTMAHVDSIADALARRDACLLADLRESVSGPGSVVYTASVRHGSPCIAVGRKPLVPCGQGFRSPVPGARVWCAEFEPEIQLYFASGGYSCLRRLATCTLTVAPRAAGVQVREDEFLLAWEDRMLWSGGVSRSYAPPEAVADRLQGTR